MKNINIKYELKSFAQTFLAVFIPMLVITLQNVDTSNLSKEFFTALSVAILRASIKAMWTTLTTVVTNKLN